MGKARGYSTWEKVAKALEAAEIERAKRRSEVPAKASVASRSVSVDPLAHVRRALSKQRDRRNAGNESQLAEHGSGLHGTRGDADKLSLAQIKI